MSKRQSIISLWIIILSLWLHSAQLLEERVAECRTRSVLGTAGGVSLHLLNIHLSFSRWLTVSSVSAGRSTGTSNSHVPPASPRPPPPSNPHTLSQTPSTGLRHPSFNHCLFSYAIGSRKLSTNEQFFGGAQTVESLLQTTQMKQGVSFIASNKVCTSANKTTIVWIETELFFFFRHLPPNSATEGALFISAQLSSDAVSALRKVRVLIWL